MDGKRGVPVRARLAVGRVGQITTKEISQPTPVARAL
jgi:hypothetical protein